MFQKLKFSCFVYLQPLENEPDFVQGGWYLIAPSFFLTNRWCTMVSSTKALTDQYFHSLSVNTKVMVSNKCLISG